MAKISKNTTAVTVPVLQDLSATKIDLRSGAGKNSSGAGKNSSGAGKNSSGAGKNSSGGGATAGATPTAAADPMETLTKNFDAMVTLLGPEPVPYEALSEEELKAQIATWLRPSYDQAIINRQDQTKSYAAELDADAISRGMGASTYVTDAKSRLKKDEGRDITILESEYGAALAKAVGDRMENDRDRQLDVTLYNKDLEMDVYSLAYNAAMALTGFGVTGGGGGGSRRGGSSRRGYGSSRSSSSGITSAKNCETFLAALSNEGRAGVYAGSTAQNQQYRDEIIASVGVAGFYELQQKYSTIP